MLTQPEQVSGQSPLLLRADISAGTFADSSSSPPRSITLTVRCSGILKPVLEKELHWDED